MLRRQENGSDDWLRGIVQDLDAGNSGFNLVLDDLFEES